MSAEATPQHTGLYRHYKHRHDTATAGVYRVLYMARDADNPPVALVVYQSVATGQVWVRAAFAFFQNVAVEGYNGPRFIPLGELRK